MAKKYFVKNTGIIKASGNDLIDFLNRMSTNDLRKFPTDEYRKTVLTSDKGRIIDLINVLNFIDHQYIITSQGFQEKVISHLDKYIITDDVSLVDSGEKYFHIIISGDEIPLTANKITGEDVLQNKIYKPDEDEYLFTDDFKIESLNIICKEKSLDKFRELLKDHSLQTCEEYEYMRIDAGIPEGENEFNDNINPMECGMDKYISFKKGCYIGQEVIARLDSQGKRPKQMVKIDSENNLSSGDKIFSEDKEAGFVSSSITHNGNNLSLGFIRSVDLDYRPEKNYFVKNGKGETIKINISKTN